MVKIALKPPALAALDTAAFSSTATEQVPMIESSGSQETVVKRRVRRCALYAAPLTVVAACLAISSTQQDPFHECDRQCRSAYGFYDRSVTGARVGTFGQHCKCERSSHPPFEPLGVLQPYQSHKTWNSSFWCGDFETSLVCAVPPPASELEAPSAPLTMTRSEAALRGLQVLHCGACAACSTLHDLEVLNASKTFATVRVTRCATAYAKPSWMGGHRDVAKLAACLADADIGFSTDGSAWAEPAGKPTCMDCWTDNVACDAVACVTNPDCIKRFFDPDGTAFAGCIKCSPASLACFPSSFPPSSHHPVPPPAAPSLVPSLLPPCTLSVRPSRLPYSLTGSLTRCDELHCGPEFIRCAGANRRSSGIVSDIARPGQQVCPVGYWSPPSPPPS